MFYFSFFSNIVKRITAIVILTEDRNAWSNVTVGGASGHGRKDDEIASFRLSEQCFEAYEVQLDT